MSQLNAIAIRSRILVYDSENANPVIPIHENFTIAQDAYQREAFPKKTATILLSEASEIRNGIIIDPLRSPGYFSHGHRVQIQFELTTPSWHTIFTGVIVDYHFSDGRREYGDTASLGQRTLELTVEDAMNEASYLEYPFDLSNVELGTSTPITTITNVLMVAKGLPPVTILGSTPAFPLTTSTPKPYLRQDLVSAINDQHQIYASHPITRYRMPFLWVDEVGQNRRSELDFAPQTFLIDGDIGDDLVAAPLSRQRKEKPPGKIKITGQIDIAIAKKNPFVGEPTETKGTLTLPVQPEDGETTVSYLDMVLSRTQETYLLSNPGASFSPEEQTITKHYEPGGMIFTVLPDSGLSFYRTSPLLLLNEQTIERKIYGGPGDRLTQVISTVEALEVTIDDQIVDAGQRAITKEETTNYTYYTNGIVKNITKTTKEARGIADPETTEPLTDLVITEVSIETWERLSGADAEGETYRYKKTISRPFGENQNPEGGTNSAESEPPETQYWPGFYESKTQDVSCDFEYLYGSGLRPNRERTFDYGNSLLSGAYCDHSAEIEAIQIHGQTAARDVTFTLNDFIIQNLWPSTGEPIPYMRVTDSLDQNVKKVFMMDSLTIEATPTQCLGSCFGLFLGYWDDDLGAVSHFVRPVPRMRTVGVGLLRTVGTDLIRIVG